MMKKKKILVKNMLGLKHHLTKKEQKSVVIPALEDDPYADIPLDMFTCSRCDISDTCEYSFDPYNIDGDCLAEK